MRNNFRRRIAGIPHLVVMDNLSQSADIRDEHRLLEMECHLRDTRLGGGFIRLHDQRSRSEILAEVCIRDELITDNNAVGQSERRDLRAVEVFVLIELPGNNELQVRQ